MKMVEYTNEDGDAESFAFVDVQGYSYIKIPVGKILDWLPVVFRSFTVQDSPAYITGHWTAAPNDIPFKSYQINVGRDYILVALYAMEYEYYSHTWKRNSDNLGYSYMSMGGGNVGGGRYRDDVRKDDEMVETGSILLASLIGMFPSAKVTDHAAWASKDGYTGQRWDNRAVLSNGLTLYQQNIKRAKEIMTEQAQQPPQDNEREKAVEKAGDVSASDTIFDDVNKSMWFADAVEFIHELGVMTGTKRKNGGHLFKPHDPLTRAEFATALVALYEKIQKDNGTNND
jgi:hypothetical protein